MAVTIYHAAIDEHSPVKGDSAVDQIEKEIYAK